MATSTDECLRYDINLAPKELETQLRIDPTLAKKSAAYNRDAGKPVRVRPAVKKISLHDALREYFDLLDTDKSGTLSFRELNRTGQVVENQRTGLYASLWSHMNSSCDRALFSLR